jgi:hypothetical protein
MAGKELNLFQFPAIDMAEFCAGSPKIVWSEMVQLHPLSAPSNDVPNDILGDSLTPRRPMAAHRAENSARRYLRQISPSIDCLLDPRRHRNRKEPVVHREQAIGIPPAPDTSASTVTHPAAIRGSWGSINYSKTTVDVCRSRDRKVDFSSRKIHPEKCSKGLQLLWFCSSQARSCIATALSIFDPIRLIPF